MERQRDSQDRLHRYQAEYTPDTDPKRAGPGAATLKLMRKHRYEDSPYGWIEHIAGRSESDSPYRAARLADAEPD